MKKVFTFLTMLAIMNFSMLPGVHAVPNLISYQGVLNDSGGSPVSATVIMTFTIYDAATGGTAMWTETQNVTVANGLFNVKLGSVQQLTSSVFAQDTRYLGIKVGSDAEITPRQQITTGSYAFKAKTVEYNVPIGTIMAWAGRNPSLIGVPALPDGWVECNGQTLNDTNSPFNGQVMPDLNGVISGTRRFLRGSSTSGTIGGADAFSWYHRHADGTSSSHTAYLGFASGGWTDYQGGTQDLKPPYYEVVWIMKIK